MKFNFLYNPLHSFTIKLQSIFCPFPAQFQLDFPFPDSEPNRTQTQSVSMARAQSRRQPQRQILMLDNSGGIMAAAGTRELGVSGLVLIVCK